jgi:hypothetical protein
MTRHALMTWPWVKELVELGGKGLKLDSPNTLAGAYTRPLFGSM